MKFNVPQHILRIIQKINIIKQILYYLKLFHQLDKLSWKDRNQYKYKLYNCLL